MDVVAKALEGKGGDMNTNEADDDDSGGQVMESIKMIIKFIVFISLLTIIPLAPFIAISYYSFKKLKLYYDERMLTL